LKTAEFKGGMRFLFAKLLSALSFFWTTVPQWLPDLGWVGVDNRLNLSAITLQSALRAPALSVCHAL